MLFATFFNTFASEFFCFVFGLTLNILQQAKMVVAVNVLVLFLILVFDLLILSYKENNG